MSRLRIFTRMAPSRPIGEMIEFVERARERGVDSVWLPDSQLNYREVWSTLGALAVSTKEIEIGVSVTNLVTRHPTVTAAAARTVWEMSGGRFMLGLGAGDSALGFDGLRPGGATALRDGVVAIRALTRGEPVQYGDFAATLRDASADVPIYVAASGPRTLRAAGAVADGVIIMLGNWRDKLRLIAEGAAEAGRPSAPPVFVTGGVVITERTPEPSPFTKAAALRLAQLEGREQFERAGVRIEVPDHTVGAPGDVGHLEDPAEIDRRIGHLVSDEAAVWYMQTYSVMGTQEEVVPRLREMSQAGIAGIAGGGGGADIVPQSVLDAVHLAAQDEAR